MKGIALVMALGAMCAVMAPSVARADPQVLTDAQMDAVTAAAGVVHLNLPAISVIVLNIPDINITANLDLGDIVVEHNNIIARNVITQVAVATNVGIAVCGVCFGSSPQVASSAFVFNSFTRHGLP
jgi:hypothetical protein